MSYPIYKSNGSVLAVINDGLVDHTTSVNLIGKNTSNFGQAQNDNFLWMLEHFANSQQPLNPITGQIWFDTNTNVLRPATYDGNTWRPLAVMLYSNTSTDAVINSSGINFSASQAGDFWYNTQNQQLYIATTSTGYQLIGPQRVPGFLDTQWKSTTVADIGGINHAVMELLVDGNVLAIASKSQFVSTSSVASLGFPTIYRGMTFANYNTAHRYVTTSTDVALYGINSFLDTTYPQRGNAEPIPGIWNFQNGIQLGQPDVNGATSSVADNSGQISIASRLGGVNFFVNQFTKIASVLPEGIVPAQANRQNLGNITYPWNQLFASSWTTGGASIQGQLTGNFQLTASSKLTPFSDLGNDLGAPTLRFNNGYFSVLSPGTQQGTITGNWKLDNGSSFLPNSDLGNSLGSNSQRFNNVYAQNFIAGNQQTLNIVGEVSVTGDILPVSDQQYNLGGPGLTWNKAFINTLNSPVVNTANLNATFTSLTDNNGVRVLQWDTDGTLNNNLDANVATQRAVKTYVDNLKATLEAEIAALKDLLNKALSGVNYQIGGLVKKLAFVPAGTITWFSGSTPPSGYLVCDGSLISNTSYPDLFAVIGFTYGGDFNTQFALPDLRGQFVRGWDAGRGLDPSRGFASTQPGDLGSHTHLFDDVWYIQSDGNNPLTGNRNLDGSAGYPARNALGEAEPEAGYATSDAAPVNDTSYNDGGVNDNAIWTIKNRTASAGTASEVRPTNVALLPIIKHTNGN